MDVDITDPLVTIVAVCYNHEAYVIQTLDSILAQDYHPIQLIIIDDRSVDGSVEKIRRWIENENVECTFIAHGENRGLCATLNEAIGLSMGEYMRFIACDDVFTENSLKRQVEILKNTSSDVALLCGNALEIDENGNEIRTYFPESYRFPENVFDSILSGNEGRTIVIHTPTVLLKKSVYDEVGLYPEELLQEDLYMWLMISSRFKVIFQNEVYVKYRILSTSISNDANNRLKLLSDRLRVVENILNPESSGALLADKRKTINKLFLYHLARGDKTECIKLFKKLMLLNDQSETFKRGAENILRHTAKTDLAFAYHLYRRHDIEIKSKILKSYLHVRIPFHKISLLRTLGSRLWRENHAPSFSIVKKLTKKMLLACRKPPLLIENLFDKYFLAKDVPMSKKVSHQKWKKYLCEIGNKPGMRILEIGSREVTGESDARQLFSRAEYIGFDYYPGENVDVVGDAHKLSSYFEDGAAFDIIYSSACFEHFAMPWVVAMEIAKLLKTGGILFVETHFSFSSHERPWHFFQFSDNALKVLFSKALGFECIEAGVSNPIVGRFSSLADDYLKNKPVTGLYCHSEYLGKKVKDVKDFDWENVDLLNVVGETKYPESKDAMPSAEKRDNAHDGGPRKPEMIQECESKSPPNNS